ncbi:hypothetical protein PIB30_069167 [Stylosanthes scabra]|uniref:Uncharacterized protein n=1 Tax=Stylosanthes scabra TaxID=79078 RepID=A0ABU6RPB8_9FABA|nr:hypothetical protein [Stylosanthes scabra]
MGTESLLTQNTRVNRAIHDQEGFLLLDSMTCDLSCSAKIGAEVAKESARNEQIMKKSLEAKFICLCVRTKTDRLVIFCLGYGLKCANDLSCRSLRATDGRNRVSLDAVKATPLPITGGP